jgi:hypothetical protein
MQRRRQRRQCQHAVAPRTIDHRHPQTGLPAHTIGSADSFQKRQRVVVAAHQDVLAVIDALPGFRIGKRGGTAAKTWARFEDQHARAGLAEGGRGAESRAAAANHNCVKRHRPRLRTFVRPSCSR